MENAVGPILRTGEEAELVIQAIRDDDPQWKIEVIDGGAYLRVQAAGLLRLTLASLQRTLGVGFEMRQLGAVLSAFAGRIATTTEEITWTLSGRAPAAREKTR